jgi:4-amino-4-deoxy-L-arabinose transferase-like glycosyltransferase
MVGTERQRAWLIPAGFFCLALFVRAMVAVLTRYHLQADAVFYFVTAKNVASGLGYILPDGRFLGSVPPAFPLFLAAVFKLFGIGLTQAVAAQVAVGAATTVLVYYGATTYFDGRVAAVAAAIFAFHPVYVWASRVVLSETLATFLLAAALLAYARAFRGSWFFALASGLLLGAAALCRSSLYLVALTLMAGLAFYRMGGAAARVRAVALTAVAFLALTGLWTYRNYRVFGEFVPATLNAGQILYEGNMRLGRGEVPTSVALRRSPEFAARLESLWGTPRADLEYERFYRTKASELLRRYPGRFALSLPGKLVHFFDPAPPPKRKALFAVWTVVGGLLMVASWAGMLLFRRPASRTFALLSPVAAVALGHVVLKPLLRFRTPVDFILIIYAAAFAAFCFQRLRRPSPARPD